MFNWWLIRLMGCLCMGILFGQDNVPDLVDIEPVQDQTIEVDLSVNDGFQQQANNTRGHDGVATRMISTTTQTPEPFSCHECTNCKSKSDFLPRVCAPGITMCYKMEKSIGNNTKRIIHRGCSASRDQCIVPDDDRNYSVESITCCTSHQCNQATQFQPLFFLLSLSLWTNLIKI